MWISEQFAARQGSTAGGFGKVSIGGGQSAVLTAGREQRLLPVMNLTFLPLQGSA
jgi:hypothetical protein